MKKATLPLTIGLVVCALFGVNAWQTHSSAPLPAQTQISAPRLEESSKPAVSVADMDKPFHKPPEITAVAKVASSAPLIAGYLHAQDLRVFAENAKQHPEAGGYYYASTALSACGEARSNLRTAVPYDQSQAGPIQAQRAQARDRLESRCRSFTNEELSIRAPSALRAEGEKLGDPIAKSWQAFERSVQQGKPTSEAFDSIVRTGDPMLIAVAAQIMVSDSAARQGKVLVGGTDVNASVASLAWDLASCKFGVDCTERTISIDRDCYFFSNCFSSLQESIESRLAAVGDSAQKATVQNLADQLARDVEARRSSRLFAGR